MILLNVLLMKFFKAVETYSSSTVVQWILRILALSHAIKPAGWPPNYHLKDDEIFDFVVVGAGSAGAVVASRLSEVPYHRVLLIEAGGDPPLASVVPSLFVTLMGTEYDWGYNVKLDDGVGGIYNNKQLPLIRGKMLGGCSSLNFEMYSRGESKDYDEWNQIAPGWDSETALHYFKKLENFTDPSVMNNPDYSSFHSTEGPVKISSNARNDYFDKINNNILNSYEELGMKRVVELDGPYSLGAALPRWTFNSGRRSSTAESYLRSTPDRNNLFVSKFTRATKILIDSDELRAYGVEVVTQSGKKLKVHATIEVILSAGSIDTPKLLMLSGVGLRNELESHGIDTLVELPVGKNMQDHALIPLVFSGKRGLDSAVQHVISATEMDSVPAPIQNGFFNINKLDGRRQFQISNTHVGALAAPVLQFACETLNMRRDFCSSIAQANILNAIDWTFLVLLHPKSRGEVKLKSQNPLDDPVVIGGYFRNENDVDDFIEGLNFMQRLVNTSYYKSVKGKLEKLNVKPCRKLAYNTDNYWRCYIRNTVSILQHPVGTCAMGPDGVVDERLRVYGVAGLRVVDASVMPTIPGGNTNIPTMMIGEKAADMIKEDYGVFVK
ncbi:unnamed protein product [Chilo suppressalis]|uniref:Glucose-methanol-choline oxidoreductase N-terminal domain-containing protein n=1 Tax=Chilo suppressalis TaxID=168631 RepID=A0ABN8L4F9_CHISP|nr:unnamed protein product [Chilo suppressalis]